MKRLFKSFSFALNGIKIMLRSEANFKIHLVFAALALWFCWFLKVSDTELLIVLLCIGWVFSMEMMNSAVEKLCNFITLQKSEHIKAVKDIAAAAVLVSAIISFFTCLIVFIPKLADLF